MTAALQIRTQERIRCLLCQKFHDISTCTEFLASDVDERWRIAKRLLVCRSCLKKGHRKIECGVSEKTATGETTIHDLLNRKDVGEKQIDEKPEENITKVCLKMSVDKKHGSSSYSNGSLQIARAVICAENEIKRTVNCILDSGAQRSFVRREVVESLELNAGDHGCSGHSKADALCTGGSGTDDPLHHVLERQRGRTCVGKVGRQQLKAIRLQLGIQWWHGPRWLTGPPQTWPRSREDTERTPLIPSGRNARQDRQHRPAYCLCFVKNFRDHQGGALDLVQTGPTFHLLVVDRAILLGRPIVLLVFFV
ncbi:hypothetical protein T02_3373 [Trichinella nativa]|uniref:Peptidase A2 domain-containing protein n=1 Tax=Trichinella nativa TaxID=6335 RepID=A0A0V1L2F6_9BILA|nr:hypothetical protein T02_3373 [Trichinella nativa]